MLLVCALLSCMRTGWCMRDAVVAQSRMPGHLLSYSGPPSIFSYPEPPSILSHMLKTVRAMLGRTRSSTGRSQAVSFTASQKQAANHDASPLDSKLNASAITIGVGREELAGTASIKIKRSGPPVSSLLPTRVLSPSPESASVDSTKTPEKSNQLQRQLSLSSGSASGAPRRTQHRLVYRCARACRNRPPWGCTQQIRQI